jgi:uncharacterized membrane protein YjjB (DUF3815 family)
MTPDVYLHILHQALFGALAAAGFGVLFNFGFRTLPWCALCGALTLSVRTMGQDLDWSLEGASFVAAITVTGCATFIFRKALGNAADSVALCGCIPMVPGAFFTKALLGFIALTAPHIDNIEPTIVMALQHMLRVLFTLIAIGAGIAIPSHLSRRKVF